MGGEYKQIFEKIREHSKGKNVAIFGAGKSGKSAANLLKRLGISCNFYEERGSKWSDLNNVDISGEFGEKECNKHSLVVYSPAFRPDCKWLTFARENGLETICEPDLGALAWGGKIIAITGTDGKTTLTKFIAKVLTDSGIDAFCAGNIGTPLCEFETKFDCQEKRIAVCELSSFQTMGAKYMKPDALIWTNFGEDHLDWHKDMKEYFAAKFRLTETIRGKIFIAGESVKIASKKYGYNLPNFAEIAKENCVRKGDYPKPFDSKIQGKNFLTAKMFFEKASEMKLFGNIRIGKAELEKSAANFELPDHRFGNFEIAQGVKFYDDSKATNTHSAIAALDELDESIIWLGGGKDKLCDLNELADTVKKRSKAAVLIGQTAEKLKKMLELRDIEGGAYIAKDMESAVKKCHELALRFNACVLFSPAFSSFGMFNGYAERGKSFLNAVLCLKNLNK